MSDETKEYARLYWSSLKLNTHLKKKYKNEYNELFIKYNDLLNQYNDYHNLKSKNKLYQRKLISYKKELDYYRINSRIGIIQGFVPGSEYKYGYIQTNKLGKILFDSSEYYSGKLTQDLIGKKVIFNIDKILNKYVPSKIMLIE